MSGDRALVHDLEAAMNVETKFNRLMKQIAEWPPEERAKRLELAARTFAQVIDQQATERPTDARFEA
jgi:hypothetical protein